MSTSPKTVRFDEDTLWVGLSDPANLGAKTDWGAGVWLGAAWESLRLSSRAAIKIVPWAEKLIALLNR